MSGRLRAWLLVGGAVLLVAAVAFNLGGDDWTPWRLLTRIALPSFLAGSCLAQVLWSRAAA